jgi:hypothetical protein
MIPRMTLIWSKAGITLSAMNAMAVAFLVEG